MKSYQLANERNNISEIIEILEQARSECGDIPVIAADYSDDGCYFINRIDIVEDKEIDGTVLKKGALLS